MTGPCDRLWEIDPYRLGQLPAKSAESFRRHLQGCADCRSQMDRDEALRNLVRRLPDVTPADLTLRRLRSRVLRDAAVGAPDPSLRRWSLAIVVSVVALSLSAWGLVSSRRGHRGAAAMSAPSATTAPSAEAPLGPASDALAGSVVASAGARWSQAREGGVEQVWLDEGSIRVHVRRQGTGERFLVMLPDGEIEVRGTTFDVTVDHGATTRVYVGQGLVELRVRGRGMTRLVADEAWIAPKPPPITSVSRRPPRASGEPVAPPAPASPIAATRAQDHDVEYPHALDLLRKGQWDEAAAALHAIAQTQPATSRTEDASFLEAVALARAGRAQEASTAAEAHLASFPGSFRRKEASILVARGASGRGDCAKARAMVAPWADDASARAALGPCAEPLR
jgi:hypothetical protein